jgi:hypothetical protein
VKFAARVQITISGTPDRELYFLPPWTKENPVYTIPISEASPVGTSIMTLIARDPVDQTNVRLFDKVLQSDPLGYFSINTLPDETPGTAKSVLMAICQIIWPVCFWPSSTLPVDTICSLFNGHLSNNMASFFLAL